MKILVSACLLGLPCRYDGLSKPSEKVLALLGHHELIPFCPEIYGGLPTPRPPSEVQGEKVFDSHGNETTGYYEKGALEALRVYRLTGCSAAILKSKSPSCGKEDIYDGSFSRRLISADGVTVRLFKKEGIPVFTENEAELL